MPYTEPRTWATGDIVTSPKLNTDVRDNQNVGSVHAHSGAAGDGAGMSLGIVLTDVFARHDTDAV